MSTHKKSYPPGSNGQEEQRQAAIPGMEPAINVTEEILSTGDLYSGQPYQRPVLERAVNKLVRAWDPRLLTPLVVSYREGRYNLVDGQHRVCAMRKLNSGKDVSVLCKVYHGMTYEQEAELYFKMDQAHGHLRLSHAMKALLESGSDAEVTDIMRRLNEAGFTWALDRSTGEPFEIQSTRAVISAYRQLGGAAFSRMLGLLAKTWNGTPNSLKASMLSGMALFLKTYETEFDDATFVKRLSAVDPSEIIHRGKADFSTNKAALRFARVIWDKFNGQQRGGRKLPYRFKG